MRKKICVSLAVIFLITASLGLAACGSGISGTYKATETEASVTFTYTIALKGSGSCSLTKSLSSQTITEYNGTYSVEDNVITFYLKWTSADIENEGEYTGTILKSGNIKLKMFGKTLTYSKI